MNAGTDGLCENDTCGPCVVPTDDTNCSTAYNGQYLCLAGVCTPGNCRTDANCTAGQICGVTVANTCGACSTDAQCQADSTYGTADICVGGDCVVGNCHTDANCSAGQICGLVTPNLCGACTTDAQCQADTNYGSGTICISGACTPGNCHSDTTCNGEICGVSVPNFCGACTTDAQCQADPHFGASTICETTAGTTQGTCVAGSCANTNATCTANTSDICCVAGGVTATCVPGNCCTSAQCGPSQACVNHTCSTCNPVTNTGTAQNPVYTYIVDPLNGNDAAATGSGTSGSPAVATAACAFKTITRALQFLGPAPAAGTIISVKDNVAFIQAGETFPLVVTANVTIQGAAGSVGATPVIHVPTTKGAFTMAAPTTRLTNLLIDGTGQAGTGGIVVTTGSAASTTIDHVTVQNMANDGIDVINTGILTIGPGTLSQGNGTPNAPRSGLTVTGTGQVTITVDAAPAAQFLKNTAHGIQVLGSGSINIGTDAGSISPAVIADGNNIANLYIQQTPAAGMATPQNTVYNFQGTNSVTTHGVHIFGGSTLKLRKSDLGGNAVNGVFVTTLNPGTPTANNSVAGIDLGAASATDPGLNFLQYATGQGPGPNKGTGVCLNLTANAGQTLMAEGNNFESAVCSTTVVALKFSNNCNAAGDVGITGFATTNKVNTLLCTN